MRALTKEQVYEAVSDLAGDAGMTADAYIASLLRQAEEEQVRKTDGLDVDLAAELNESRQLRRDSRRREREALRKSEMEEDIRRFKEYFPDITAADIPEEVWAEVAQGVSLTHAYALYRAAAGAADAKARSLNRVNAERSAPLGTEGDPTDALTQEQVERHESAGGEKELQPHSRLYEKLAALSSKARKTFVKEWFDNEHLQQH